MEEINVREVAGILADECAPDERVTLYIQRNVDGTCRLSITDAPSHVLDAVSDNGYHLSVAWGHLYVTEEPE